MPSFRTLSGWAHLLPALLGLGTGLAADSSVTYKFGDSPLPGLPQNGSWTDGENWSPAVCLQYNGEGRCIQKGYPGQQPANAAEFVFHKVSITPTPTIPPGPVPVDASLDLGVMASVAEATIGSQTTLNVAGALGLNWYALPVIGSSPDWKEAMLEVDGRVSVTGKIFSNGIMAITGLGSVELLGGRIEATRLSNTCRIFGGGTITRLSGTNAGFSNLGLIEASISGIPLILDALPPAYTAANAGEMRANKGGILRIQGNGPLVPSGMIENAGGMIAALAGSRVELYSLDIRNGELATEGSGRIEVTGPNVAIRTVTNTGLLNVNDGQQLTLGGSITNNGTIRLDSTGATTQLHVTGTSPDDCAVGGNGVLELTHSTCCLVSGTGTTGFGFLNGSEHTIRGAGLIEKFRRVSNWGLVDADIPDQRITLVSTTGGSLNNTGVMRARQGATLELTGFEATAPISFNNVGGIVQARDNSIVQLTYMTLTGGVLTTEGSGVIRLPASATTIGNLQNLGTLEVRGNTTLLGGVFANNGRLLLGSGGAGANLSISPGTILTGGGTLAMSNSPANSIASAAVGTGSLVNESGHTIRGAGNIGAYGMALTNRGLIEATETNSLVLAESGAAVRVTNEGTLRAGPGSTLQINRNLTNFSAGDKTLVGGRYEVLGTLRLPVDGGVVRNAADIVLDGVAARFYEGSDGTSDALTGFATNLPPGRFELRHGRQTTVGPFINHGHLVLGSGCAFTSSQGFTQTSGGKTRIAISGAPGVPNGSGRMAIVGPGSLGGTLHVHFQPSVNFIPASGQTWRLLSGASLGGTFDSVAITGLPLTLQGQVAYAPGEGVDITLGSRSSYNYTQWADNTPFLVPADATPSADPDHDGILNEVEFAFGMDPLASDPDALPHPSFDGNSLELTFDEPTGVTGVVYAAETSTMLQAWTPVPDSGNGTTHVFRRPAGTDPSLLMRHRVTLKP